MRTIPAEKPTATPHGVPCTPEVAEYLNEDKQSTFSGNPEWPKTPTKLEELQAHADKLAEALKALDMAHNHKTLVVAKQNARAALAAYKESR